MTIIETNFVRSSSSNRWLVYIDTKNKNDKLHIQSIHPSRTCPYASKKWKPRNSTPQKSIRLARSAYITKSFPNTTTLLSSSGNRVSWRHLMALGFGCDMAFLGDISCYSGHWSSIYRYPLIQPHHFIFVHPSFPNYVCIDWLMFHIN